MKLQKTHTLTISAKMKTNIPSPNIFCTEMLTQLFAHSLQVVQVISHGVGEIHKNIKIQRAFGWSKHLHIHHLLLSGQKTHAHLLWGHLRLLKPNVDLLPLKRRKKGKVKSLPNTHKYLRMAE